MCLEHNTTTKATVGSPMPPAGIQTEPPCVVAVLEYFRNHIVIIVFPTRRRIISFNFTDGVYIRQTKGAPFKFLVPLIYVPVLPLIQLTLRHQPVLRDRLFTTVLVGEFAHGSYLVSLLDKNIIFENTIESNKGMCLSITM
ncbi:hypothetical protein LXL04_003146 [Taraxacum kok-saghyz]